MSGLDKPTLKELNASTKPGCKCVECAIDYGDQALDASEKEIERLKAELKRSNDGWDAANEQCVDLEIMSKIIDSDDMLSEALEIIKRDRDMSKSIVGLYDAKCKEVAELISEAAKWKKRSKKNESCQVCLNKLACPAGCDDDKQPSRKAQRP